MEFRATPLLSIFILTSHLDLNNDIIFLVENNQRQTTKLVHRFQKCMSFDIYER